MFVMIVWRPIIHTRQILGMMCPRFVMWRISFAVMSWGIVASKRERLGRSVIIRFSVSRVNVMDVNVGSVRLILIAHLIGRA